MSYPTSANLIRLIDRLIAVTEPKAMTIGQLHGLSNAITAVQATDPAIARLVSRLDLYQLQLTETQDKKQYARLGITPGQLDIDGNDAA